MNSVANTNQEDMPKAYERKDIIKLSSDIVCDCGRLKDRPHCPECGRTKLTGFADTIIAMIPGTQDIIKDARIYRCSCGNKYNDIDWYFSCHAPKKIDWAATKKKHKNQQLQESIATWMDRIRAASRIGIRLDHNDRVKCKAETGISVEDFITMMRNLDKDKKVADPRKIAKNAYDAHVELCQYCLSNIDHCPEGQQLKDELDRLKP